LKNKAFGVRKFSSNSFYSHMKDFPQNLYETPHTLGIDRMVLPAGATQFPKMQPIGL
jgi:hypothetical protein